MFSGFTCSTSAMVRPASYQQIVGGGTRISSMTPSHVLDDISIPCGVRRRHLPRYGKNCTVLDVNGKDANFGRSENLNPAFVMGVSCLVLQFVKPETITLT